MTVLLSLQATSVEDVVSPEILGDNSRLLVGLVNTGTLIFPTHIRAQKFGKGVGAGALKI